MWQRVIYVHDMKWVLRGIYSLMKHYDREWRSGSCIKWICKHSFSSMCLWTHNLPSSNLKVIWYVCPFSENSRTGMVAQLIKVVPPGAKIRISLLLKVEPKWLHPGAVLENGSLMGAILWTWKRLRTISAPLFSFSVVKKSKVCRNETVLYWR